MYKQLSKQDQLVVELVRNGFLLIQGRTDKGYTVTLERTAVGSWVEPFAGKEGFGHDLTDILRNATWGMPGMTVRQLSTGKKQVYVDITGI